MRRVRLAMMAVSTAPLAGCGTFSNAMCGPYVHEEYYSGVRYDLDAMKEGGAMTLIAADLPFSAAADTLLLPFQTYSKLAEIRRQNLKPLTLERSEADQLAGTPPPPPQDPLPKLPLNEQLRRFGLFTYTW